jgi:pyridoxal phosphate enzyme (YggS family)
MPEIAHRLAHVRERLTGAARDAGRRPEEIRIVAVSKRKPVEDIRAAYAEGLRDFGENYVQELQAKADALADLPGLRLHMIGHLQRNKARHVVRCASAVQTIDSVQLAREVGKRAADHPIAETRRFGPDARLVVLVEVNVGGEAQKSGCDPAALEEVLGAIDEQPALALRGLMTVPPHTEDPARARPFFDQLVQLREAHGGAVRLPELSMGMTHDLEHAVAAGATMVRIGTAIFGPRPPKPAGL